MRTLQYYFDCSGTPIAYNGCGLIEFLRVKVVAFKIGLLGLGTVGAGTAEILLSRDWRHPLLQELEILSVGVRDILELGLYNCQKMC